MHQRRDKTTREEETQENQKRRKKKVRRDVDLTFSPFSQVHPPVFSGPGGPGGP